MKFYNTNNNHTISYSLLYFSVLLFHFFLLFFFKFFFLLLFFFYILFSPHFLSQFFFFFKYFLCQTLSLSFVLLYCSFFQFIFSLSLSFYACYFFATILFFFPPFPSFPILLCYSLFSPLLNFSSFLYQFFFTYSFINSSSHDHLLIFLPCFLYQFLLLFSSISPLPLFQFFSFPYSVIFFRHSHFPPPLLYHFLSFIFLSSFIIFLQILQIIIYHISIYFNIQL